MDMDISITVLISGININLLPNTCNFHHNFWLIFSLHLSENAHNVHFREAKLEAIWAGLTLNCIRRACISVVL